MTYPSPLERWAADAVRACLKRTVTALVHELDAEVDLAIAARLRRWKP